MYSYRLTQVMPSTLEVQFFDHHRSGGFRRSERAPAMESSAERTAAEP